MKKIILLIAIAGIFTCTNANAQRRDPAMSGPRIGLGADFAFPQSNFGNIADYGVGVSLLYQHPVAKNLNITGNVGYLRFNGDGVFANIRFREGYVPIKGGARYFITENIYGSGAIGIAISTANGSGTGTAFIYTPGLGVEFPVSNSGSIELGASYDNWTRSNGTRSFIGLRAGYNF